MWWDLDTKSQKELLQILHANDPIAHDSVFTNGMLKIMSGAEDSMKVQERQKCEFLLRNEPNEAPEVEMIEGNSLGAVFEARKKQRLSILAERPTSKYIKLGWIPCTTCEVERLFSKCRHIFSEFRKGFNPETMEIILYLRVNRAYWDISTVGEAVREWDTANLTVMAFLDVGEENVGINDDEE